MHHIAPLTHSIVICVHNALEDVIACVESLLKSETDFLEIIIVDDSSEAPTRDYIASVTGSNGIVSVRNPIRQGYTKTANIGMRMARGDVVTLLNSDTILPARWSAKVVQAFTDNPQVGVIGPMSNAASLQSIPSTSGTADQTAINALPPGVTVDAMDAFCEKASAGQYLPFVPLVHGFCMSISRPCLDTVGLFDEAAFPMGYGEENDFCIRTGNAGFALAVMINSYVFHAKSKSYASNERAELMRKGWEALLEKHGRTRLVRSVKIMEAQPQLAELRAAAIAAFDWGGHAAELSAQAAAERPAPAPTPAVAPPPAPQQATDGKTKAIAFYLPQFHPIPFNDRTWGEGFTEWWNVAQARPRFPGHVQPKLPGNFGFYDLRRKEVLAQQAALAASHGLAGFAVYYYRLGGRRLLHLPTDTVLADPSIPFNFLYCWANESWTRAWDGKTSDVLLPQEYDDATFWGIVNDVAQASDDPRYITVAGRPLFMIYQVAEIPDAARWVDRMRSALRKATGKDFLIASVYSVNFKPEMLQFLDFVVQFPPHRIPRVGRRITVSPDMMKPFEPERADYYEAYDDIVEAAIQSTGTIDRLVPGVCPDWDNTSRRQNNAHTVVGSSPDKFQNWARRAAAIAGDKANKGLLPDKMLFVNAWNEWAEGAVLEPTRSDGLAYLTSLQAALQSTS